MSEGFLDLAAYILGGGTTAVSNPPEAYVPLAYPIEVPLLGGASSIDWGYDTVRPVSESPFTFHQLVHVHQGERLRAAISLAVMTREALGQWASLLMNLDGGYGIFWFGDFIHPRPLGSALGSPVVDGANQKGRTLSVSGMTANAQNVFKQGDKIQVGNALHVITRDVSVDSYGRLVLELRPRLRVSPSDGQAIITESPKGLFRLAKNSINVGRVSVSGKYEILTFEVVEAV